MIRYVEQNIFESPAQVIVNTVNTVGVMGKGIAKDFKKYYPEMFKEYQRYCEIGALEVGKLWLYKTPNKWVLNFPTKKHWRNPSRLDYIESGLKKFVDTYKEKGIKSISFPQLGVGNGGLNWERQVKPLMEKYLEDLPIDIFIHLYSKKNSKPEYEDQKLIKEWLNSNPKLLSFAEVQDDLERIINFEVNTMVLNDEKVELSILMNKDESDSVAIVLHYVNFGSYRAIYFEELFNIWSLLRDNGFVLESEISEDRENMSKEIIAILDLLPYVSVIYTKEENSNYLERLLTHNRIELASNSLQEELVNNESK